MQNTITILLHCTDLPGVSFEDKTAVRLGIQKGKDVIDDVPADTESVIFTCPLRVERNTKTGKPNFLGPFAHGTPEERFIYLCWGERKGMVWYGFRRAKIHLKHIEWSTIEDCLKTDSSLEATLRMTDSKGGPLCASVGQAYITWK